MIYLDHAAATPVDERVLAAMEPYFTVEFFNPSAAYLPAKKVAQDYEAAKATIAHAIGAKGTELVMTAGATEANNLALGVVKQSDDTLVAGGARILYLETEHDSVRAAATRLGGAPIQVLLNGAIDLNDLKAKLTDDVELITVALVNNELGTIQPLAEIAAMIKTVRLDRWRRGIKTPVYLHSDASQALNLLDVNVARLGVDLMTLNAAKIYGPKGVGALYAAPGVKLSPLTVGGGQEKGLRSGTENVPGVVGFAKAITRSQEHLNYNRKKYAEFKKVFLSEIQGCEVIPRAVPGLFKGKTLDNFVNICYNGIDGERLVYLLEDLGVYVATGAACAASKGVQSHVLKAVGLSDSEIRGSIRITFGETNTLAQVKQAAKILNEVTAKERERINGQ